MAERYQKEIEEILDRVNDNKPAGDGSKGSLRTRKRKSAASGSKSGGSLYRLTPGRLLVAGIVLLVVALVTSGELPNVAKPLAWVGIALFIVAYVLFFTGHRRPAERRWRGQPIDYEAPTGGNPIQRFWRWISRG